LKKVIVLTRIPPKDKEVGLIGKRQGLLGIFHHDLRKNKNPPVLSVPGGAEAWRVISSTTTTGLGAVKQTFCKKVLKSMLLNFNQPSI